MKDSLTMIFLALLGIMTMVIMGTMSISKAIDRQTAVIVQINKAEK